jgi:hypothetical protein
MAASKKDEAAPERATVRLTVRTAPVHGDAKRYRAGLGPFGRDPVTVEASLEQAEALKADPVLIVTEAE